MKTLSESICEHMRRGSEMYRTVNETEASDKVKVILTGSPRPYGYKTKAEFMAKHPNLVEVKNMNDADILITSDTSSLTSKMRKARALGVQIRTYETIWIDELFLSKVNSQDN